MNVSCITNFASSLETAVPTTSVRLKICLRPTALMRCVETFTSTELLSCHQAKTVFAVLQEEGTDSEAGEKPVEVIDMDDSGSEGLPEDDNEDMISSSDEEDEVVEQVARPAPEPSPQPTPQPSPQPASQPTPQPSPQPAPQPTPRPTPEPSPQPAPQPTPEPSPQPAAVGPTPFHRLNQLFADGPRFLARTGGTAEVEPTPSARAPMDFVREVCKSSYTITLFFVTLCQHQFVCRMTQLTCQRLPLRLLQMV